MDRRSSRRLLLLHSVNDTGNRLIAWLATGTGTLLLYSAVRNRKPLDVLRDVQGSPLVDYSLRSAISGGSNPKGRGSPVTNVTGIPRLRMIANREIPPELVPIKPFGKLERSAAESKNRIDAKLGYAVPHTSGYRSYAVQAAGHASDPNRFADPKKSLHVVGLAIDVHSSYANLPEVVQAFTEEGWHRYDPEGEPWHYSYGVRG